MNGTQQKKQIDGIGLDGMYQVTLYNDDHNTCEHVIASLMRIFGHSYAMSMKLMMEAHTSGKTIAQVEGKGDALRHMSQLHNAGLSATVERI